MRILLIVIAFVTIEPVFSQDEEKKILDKFFQIYQEDTSKALDYLYGTTRWVDSNSESVKQLKGQLKQYEELVGEFYGEEFIYKGKVGSSFVTYIYLVKYERQPFRFTFEFYKANDKWIVQSFKFDDSFDEDLEEIMKYEYLQTKY